MEEFTEVELLEPWDGRPAGARLCLRRWLAVNLVLRYVAWPVNPAEWRS